MSPASLYKASYKVSALSAKTCSYKKHLSEKVSSYQRERASERVIERERAREQTDRLIDEAQVDREHAT